MAKVTEKILNLEKSYKDPSMKRRRKDENKIMIKYCCELNNGNNEIGIEIGTQRMLKTT